MRTALTALVLGTLCALGGLVARPATAAANSDQVRFRIGLLDVFPPKAVTDLAGAAGGEGQALLTWSAPASDDLLRPKPDPAVQYLVRTATFPAADLGGDTTAWFDAATPLVGPAPQGAGSAQSLLTQLEGGTTYWFGLRSVDAAGLTSLVDTKTAGVVLQAQVPVKGIRGVTNLTAVTGASPGEVDLVWTAPRRIGTAEPSVYEVRASSVGQIADAAQFEAARPLSAFSPTPPPGLGSPGDLAAFTATGLSPGVTYYFAVRAVDAGGPAFKGLWRRDVPAGINALNTAQARFIAGQPDTVTDLTALPGSEIGDIRLTWTAPPNPNGVPLKEYVLKISTKSVADLGGNATAWFQLTGATAVVKSPVAPAGSTEALVLQGMDLSGLFYFGLKTVDILGETSFIDLGASGGYQANSRPRPVPPIINLTAVAVSTESGRIDLEWTSPNVTGMIPPLAYDMRVSTLANIPDNAAFNAALPLTAFSASQPPAVSSATLTYMPVTGLTPNVTYYFAIRTFDSNPNGTVVSDWVRSVSSGVNVNNSAVAPRVPNPPDPVTDLTALVNPGTLGAIDLSWTAPRNQNFVPVGRYEVTYATFSTAQLAGDATAWFLTAAASHTTVYAPPLPGSRVDLTLTGLIPADLYFFGVRAVDAAGETSQVDFGLDPALPPAQARERANGIAGVTDLTALPDGASGAIDLAWTAPARSLAVPPERYVMRVSTTGNIAGDAAFAAAQPLSAFSSTPLPAVAAIGAPQTLTVTGLLPFTTYYFALRVEDSSATPNFGVWIQDGERNPLNFAVPAFQFQEPDPISDLTTLPGGLAGEIRLEWTAPANPNFVPISSYTVRAATFSPAALAGDATAWFNAASLSYVYYPAGTPGVREVLTLSGLAPGAEYFFGLRAFDQIGEAGHLDLGLDPTHPKPQTTGRPRGVGAVTDLVAKQDGGAGVVELSWTTPFRILPALPERYAVRMSTTGQISDDAQFAAASPLSAFSGSPIPAPAAGASRQVFNVTGLTPFTTYYFAVRVEDSSATPNVGVWLRDPLLARNTANFSVPSFFVNIPEPVTDLTALPGVNEGEVSLTWTAPLNQNLMPIVRYEVRYATVPVAALANDATAWYAAAPFTAAVNTAQAPGAVEQLTLTGLYPLTTFYFAVRSEDVLGERSFVDVGADPSDPRPQAGTRPRNLPPGTPSGLAAVAGLRRAAVSWTDLPAGVTGAGKGLDFAHYRLERSTNDVVFAAVTTQTALSYTDRPLTAETSYYFRLVARDLGGLESAPSASVPALPFTLAPQEPFGLRFSRTTSSITLSWSPTTRFETTEPFFDPAVPTSDELSGYRIERSTGDCGAPFVPFASYGLGVTSHTEADSGQSYFYKVMAVNDFKASTAAIIMSPFGDQIYSLPDCASRLVVGETLAGSLIKGTNGLSEDIYLQRRYRLEENGGDVVQTVEFVPLAGGGGAPVKNFAFAKPVRVTLRFQTDAQGKPVPATAQAVAQDASAAAQGLSLAALTPAAAEEAKHLSLYWNDGKEYKKLYGQVDTTAQTVSAQTPNIGGFQVRRVFRDAAATFDLSNITTRVISPNGDGKNDVMIMLFDNPRGAAITGKIYDLRGAYVATMAPGPQPDSLQWDGMMNGKKVTSGVYIYQVEGDGKLFNGTCVVAR